MGFLMSATPPPPQIKPFAKLWRMVQKKQLHLHKYPFPHLHIFKFTPYDAVFVFWDQDNSSWRGQCNWSVKPTNNNDQKLSYHFQGTCAIRYSFARYKFPDLKVHSSTSTLQHASCIFGKQPYFNQTKRFMPRIGS